MHKKIQQTYFSTVNTKINTKKDMVEKLGSVKGKTKLKFCRNMSDSYNQINYMRQIITLQFEEDSFITNARGIAKIMHEALLLMKF